MIRLAVRVARGQAEAVLADLLELAPGGVEEVEHEDGTVEYAVYGPPGELPALPDLRALAGEALVEVASRPVPDDWQERWKSFHRPVLVRAPEARLDAAAADARLDAAAADAGLDGAPAVPPGTSDGGGPWAGASPALLIRPPWEPAEPRDSQRLEIVIDPGRAFGTGAHATTRLCLALLLELAASESTRGTAVDVGTGSGVLAIAASRLGFAPVLALDNDPASITAAAANAQANGVELDVRRHDLRAGSLEPGRVLLANLLRPLLLSLGDALRSAPEHLVAGGLLVEEADEVCTVLARRHGLHERRRLTEGEWAAVWLAAQPRSDSAGDSSGSSVAAHTFAR